MMWWGGLVMLMFGVLMLISMAGHGGHGQSGHVRSTSDARGLLAKRFARGEISEDEFKERMRVLDRRPTD